MTGFCACDFDPPTLYKQAVHRAKREYRCDECGGRIAPGDTYERSAGLEYGKWWSNRTCQPCLDGPRAFLERNCGCWEQWRHRVSPAQRLQRVRLSAPRREVPARPDVDRDVQAPERGVGVGYLEDAVVGPGPYGPWRTRPPASTISHTTLPASPEAQAEYERLVALPTAEALAELARMGDPWWLRDAVLRVAGERA